MMIYIYISTVIYYIYTYLVVGFPTSLCCMYVTDSFLFYYMFYYFLVFLFYFVYPIFYQPHIHSTLLSMLDLHLHVFFTLTVRKLLHTHTQREICFGEKRKLTVYFTYSVVVVEKVWCCILFEESNSI